ncbi:hypothetical protein [Streptomyces mirabilis]|uniref:hypothetical protein n=1 Tax=Streptomyces mirabilis TaxID=68239 RepID=UPI0036CAAAB4
MICRTPEEAWQAGLELPCEHGVRPLPECPDCRLTEAEIADLAVLLGSYLRPTSRDSEAA